MLTLRTTMIVATLFMLPLAGCSEAGDTQSPEKQVGGQARQLSPSVFDEKLAPDAAQDGGAAADGEPSEEAMLAAIQAKIDQVNANYKAVGEKCERREFQNDPMMALQCLQLCGGSAGACGMEFELTRFEKLGCEKAIQQAGYICDYIAGFASTSPFAQGAMNTITGGDNAGQGRFLRQEGGWLFLPLQRY